jgi:hypothetical protein
MTTLDKILYVTIKGWQLEERMRRDDFAFDAFDYLSKKIGYKNSSILHKMCEPRVSATNSAKIGVLDVTIIMAETKDYRLLEFIRADLVRRQEVNEQLNLFSQPLRTL